MLFLAGESYSPQKAGKVTIIFWNEQIKHTIYVQKSNITLFFLFMIVKNSFEGQ